MRNRLIPLVKRTGVVIGSVGASTLLARALEPYVAGLAPLLPFTLAVIASAWYGGMITGLAATILSFFTADYLFIDPKYQILPFSPIHGILFLLFLATGISISTLKTALARNTAALRSAIQKLDIATQRYELAAQHGRIGFQDYLTRDNRQIWTPEMEKLFGLAPGTFEGTYADWVKRIHPDDRDRVTQERQFRIAHQQPDWECEYRAVLPDGSIRWMEGRSRLFFSKSGSLDRILGATIDITERRQLEQAVRERSEQLAKANQELERFAYVVSHDLKEPLRGITAMTQLFLRRTRASLAPDSAELLDFVVKNCERMRRLISEVLDFARVGSDLPVSMNDVNFAGVLETVIEELRGVIDESHARIKVDAMPVVRANENQVVRLFMNLLGNAIKYRGEQAPEIHVNARYEEGEWIFCVSDNGIGIDPKYQGQIFRAFQRLHGAAEYEGTGLGLAICQRILQRHNGRLWVESEPNKGSKFYFTLPADVQSQNREDAVEREPGRDSQPARRGRTAAG
jgi:PAS domain S-box-containing protein